MFFLNIFDSLGNSDPDLVARQTDKLHFGPSCSAELILSLGGCCQLCCVGRVCSA